MCDMANGLTYGISFPFRQSEKGNYLNLTDDSDEEIRTSLLHLILTKRGSRYYLPDFGTNIYSFIFDPLDGQTFDAIKDDIKTRKYFRKRSQVNSSLEKPETLAEWIVIVQPFYPLPYASQ